MAVRQDTLWNRFLQPIFSFLLDEEEMRQLSKSKDWEALRDRVCQPDLVYPDYYLSQNFHGVEGGYLNLDAAITYDPITQYVLPPGEIWVRQEAINRIGGQPRRILDLGCGTGSTTLLLKKAFPQAEVIGLDLSPYMLAMAEHKATEAGLRIEWQHGKAEATGFPNESFDLVTASLLFHETPPAISQSILRECFRLLQPGGQVTILDGNQKTLRHTEWLTNVFEEPYIQDYAKGSTDAWMGAAGFDAVQTEEIWWIHQITRGLKPLGVEEAMVSQYGENTEEGIPAPAF
ncbi:methyltransferase domain-containing protein [Lusitaniella coriacea LEGE 07157]|uniref:Methyltransferase domain-containing protein n=1 Tax=Lusitaniella coriacea LEGE 07157 TaxID=945747 RepID=A0A8J7ARM2_9CYAN|nr:class I SAM-dependent methyltransferase [Lusitaniella coriacea]MBE9114851.1 methyltransferase domain-containing protein [Lusitaniella coriacea LEGE 07157]